MGKGEGMTTLREMIDHRLCPVCLREGVEKSIHEHDGQYPGHVLLTKHALKGDWVVVHSVEERAQQLLPPAYIQSYGGKKESVTLFSFLDYWNMAVEVGGFFLAADLGTETCAWFAASIPISGPCDSPESAVVHAWLEKRYAEGWKR